MKKQFGDWYLGLDIGTESVGWAVTDMAYQVQKLNGKALWGSRLFDGGETAEDRRGHRTARRRQQRQVQRLGLLQEIFAQTIAQKDPGFFRRLEESKYLREDKQNPEEWTTLFCDSDYTDKEYHAQYPTIYHLRQALMQSDDPFDVRLVYLAIHHILKKRGHFLFPNQNIQSITNFQNVYIDLQNMLRDEFEIALPDEKRGEIETVLKDNKKGKREKEKELTNHLGINSKQVKAICGLMIGGKKKLADIFDDEDLKQEELNTICFSDALYEDNYLKYESILQERMICIDKLKAIYDWALLEEILHGLETISQAKVEVYDRHKTELMMLKEVVKAHCPEKYKEIFVEVNKKDNYVAYIGMTKKNGKKQMIEKRCDQEAFCKYIKGILTKMPQEERVQVLLTKAENNTLLTKATNKDNGVIPHQLHQKELEIILKKAEVYLPFLAQKDEIGYTASQKIVMLFTFRIPYYVGPLNPAHQQDDIRKGTCWIVKKSEESIRPWNFESVVDVEASAENFIRRMTNKCTYLLAADVLPKASILYSKFMVLNELNNLCIEGTPISVEVKQNIFDNLFLKHKKVTQKRLRSYLIAQGACHAEETLTGIDGDIKASMASAIDFKAALGEKATDHQMVENLILWITLFGEDKKLLKRRIEKEYQTVLTQKEIAAVCRISCNGWGRLSKEFLEDITDIDPETGEIRSIIQMLWESNDNLMQILSGRYAFAENVKAYNAEATQGMDGKITPEILEDLYVSPAVKRSIWQTLKIIEEIRKIMGKAPKKIFVEMAREQGKKQRTISRKNQLISLYKNCKDESRNWVGELEGKSDRDLRGDRLYLYYTQQGRCMYSGEPIRLEDLYNKNVYDIDHIYPRSKTKDDSMDNRVLVKRAINAKKEDVYPLPTEIQQARKALWNRLYHSGLISKKKYDRLTRTTPFKEDELAGFIARQLVETRQSTKAVAQIVDRVFPESNIVYAKAGNVSSFRQEYELIKCRDVNDFHHAKDAYLNIVVGNVYDTKFTQSPMKFIKSAQKYSLNTKVMYKYDVERNGTLAWKAGESGTITMVRRMMKKNNILFTRYACEGKGQLFKVQPLKKGKGQLSLKGSDPKMSGEEGIKKYGGYKDVMSGYFMLVEHTAQEKRIRTLEVVPIYMARALNEDTQKRMAYCKELGLVDPRILILRIKINALLEVDGFRMHITGRSNDNISIKNANQFLLSTEQEMYLKKISKFNNRKKENPALNITDFDKITKEENTELFKCMVQKLGNKPYNVLLSKQFKVLNDKEDPFRSLSIEEQCIALMEIMHFFECNVVVSNLKLLGGVEKAGKLLMNKNIMKWSSIFLINQSVTGVFEQRINLLEL